jgi:hypothetical protein
MLQLMLTCLRQIVTFAQETCRNLHTAIERADVSLDEVVDLLWPSFYNHLTTRLGFVFASGIADAFHHVSVLLCLEGLSVTQPHRLC